MATTGHGERAISRRGVLRLFGLAATTALVAACRPSSPAQPVPTSPPLSGSTSAPIATVQPGATVAAVDQPRSGGILRQGNLGDLPTLDGNFLNGQSTIYPVWDRLVELDPQLNPVGILAEGWDVDDKYTRIALRLRQGVQWHTGRELTSDDVAWNIRRVSSDPKVAGGGFYNWMSQTLTGIETPDKYTTVLLAERSWPAVFDTLSLLCIIDPVTFAASGPGKPTGTGPFTFADYAQGDHFTLTRNPNYWQSGKPYLDGVEIKIFKDPQTMMTELEAGAIDLVLSPPIHDVARLSKDPTFVTTFNAYSGGANLVFVQMKDDAGPTTNKALRQALNAAIDRQRWADAVLLGYGAPKTLPLAPPNPGYDAARDQAVAFDLDKAKSLLQQSGVGTPPLEVIWNATVTDYATVMQIYQQDLAKIGLDLTLKPTEPVTFVDQTYNSKFPSLATSATLYGNLRPGFFAGNVYYSPFNNWSGFRSDRLLQLTDGLLHETDPARQKQIYADWMDYIQDESWAMPWSNTAPRFMQTAKVHGVRWNLADYMMTNDAWLT
ncbi:MAG: ABC transporter substrate-binding protein [Chloroflexi bacterium]|nr:ABC transporter substrate-binding protein [Chloroflexota bacterium]